MAAHIDRWDDILVDEAAETWSPPRNMVQCERAKREQVEADPASHHEACKAWLHGLKIKPS
jgi:hypothetical protein